MAAVAAQLNDVVASQPIHAADRKQAETAVEAFLGVLPDDAGGKDFYVSVSGSVSWSGDYGSAVVTDLLLTAVSINVSASLAAKA
jgi:hypothetical protein